jgi:very-short-patch-repair endonuclease
MPHRKFVPYRRDLNYCSSRRLIIEVDGDSHFTPAAQSYDERRTGMLEVLEQFEGVCQRILEALKT